MTQEQASIAFRELGLAPTAFRYIWSAPSVEVAAQLLKDLQVEAKKGYRAAARRLHPDYNSGDEDKVELFRLVTEAHDEIQSLKVRQHRRRRRTRRRVYSWTESGPTGEVRVTVHVG